MPFTKKSRLGDITTTPIAFSDTLSRTDRRDLISFSLSKSSDLSIQQTTGVKVEIFKRAKGLLKSFGLNNLNDSGFKGAKAVAPTNLAAGEYLARISYSGKGTKRYRLNLSATPIAPAPISTDQQPVVVPPIGNPSSNQETSKDPVQPVTYTYKIETRVTQVYSGGGYRHNFITKRDSNGVEVWSRPIERSFTGFDLEVGTDGSYYVAGEKNTSTALASESPYPQNPTYVDHTDAIVIKYSPEGKELWRSTFAKTATWAHSGGYPFSEGYRDIWLDGGFLRATGYKEEYAGLCKVLETKIDIKTGAIAD